MDHPTNGADGDAQGLKGRISRQGETGPIDFAPTRPDDGMDGVSGWWPESSDGECGQNAVEFAASQSAPLNVV